MAISKYTLYKYAKVDGTRRCCKAAYHDNGKIKPDIVFVNVTEGLLEKHAEGRYYMSHNGGLDRRRDRRSRGAAEAPAAARARREYNRLRRKGSAQSTVVLPHGSGRATLAAAAEKYFADCEARGNGRQKYPQVPGCGRSVRPALRSHLRRRMPNKQVLLDYLGRSGSTPSPSANEAAEATATIPSAPWPTR